MQLHHSSYFISFNMKVVKGFEHIVVLIAAITFLLIIMLLPIPIIKVEVNTANHIILKVQSPQNILNEQIIKTENVTKTKIDPEQSNSTCQDLLRGPVQFS